MSESEREALAWLLAMYHNDTDGEDKPQARLYLHLADAILIDGFRQEHKPRGPQHDALVAATEEAMIRNPPNRIVNDPFGATGEAESDPYGYDEEARRHFVAGALFEHQRTA